MASTIMRSFPLTRRRTEAKSFSLPALFTIVLIVVALISLLYLAQTSAVATAGYDVKRLEDQKAQWQMRNEQLRAKIAQLESLERVEAEAANRLKMGPPAKVLFVPVDLKAVGPDARLTADSGASSSDTTKEGPKNGKSHDENPWLNALRGTLGL